MRKAALIAGILGLITIITYSFMLVGSPAHNRELLADQARINALEYIDCVIRVYVREKKNMPSSLIDIEKYIHSEELRGQTNSCAWRVSDEDEDVYFKDPVTNQYYEFIPHGDFYNICANFAFNWEELRKSRNIHSEDKFRNYDKGRHCFELKVQP